MDSGKALGLLWLEFRVWRSHMNKAEEDMCRLEESMGTGDKEKYTWTG